MKENDAKQAENPEDKLEATEGEATASAAGVNKSSKKKLLMIAVPAIVVLLAGAGGAYYYFTQKSDVKDAKTQVTDSSKKEDNKTLFVDLDPFLVNLNSAGEQSKFLKMSITLQVSSGEVVKKIEEKLPVIRDACSTYLRELRPDDLQGSAGMYRIKEELLLRLNETLVPNKIDDVLFRDLLIQ